MGDSFIRHVTESNVLLLEGSDLQVGAIGVVESLSHAASVRVLATWKDAGIGQVKLAGSGRTVKGLIGDKVSFE